MANLLMCFILFRAGREKPSQSPYVNCRLGFQPDRTACKAILRSRRIVLERLEPQFQVDELPEEHHMVFAGFRGGDNLLVLVDQAEHLGDVIDAAFSETLRMDQIEEPVPPDSGEPDVSGSVPAGL